MRRHQCENVDADPLVWTNQRFMRWAHNIDLGEFAENLKGKISSIFPSMLFSEDYEESIFPSITFHLDNFCF